MNEGVYFADVELPFHVWVRERTGTCGYRWVLRDATPADEGAPLADPGETTGGA